MTTIRCTGCSAELDGAYCPSCQLWHGMDRLKACDMSITCDVCLVEMEPEHAHYRCPKCRRRDSCCDWAG